MSSKSASQAAGRAAEDIVLEKILWRLQDANGKSGEVLGFYEAVERKLITKPKGVGSDDFLVKFEGGRFALVESKASFKSKPEKYIEKASRQLAYTALANSSIESVMLALVDLTRKQIRLALVDRSAFLEAPLVALRTALKDTL